MVYAKARKIKGEKKNKPKMKSLEEELQEKAYKWFPEKKWKPLNKLNAYLRKIFLEGERRGARLYQKLHKLPEE